LKKGKWKASEAVKVRIVSPWKSQARQWANMQWCISQNSGAGFETILNNNVWSYSVDQKRKLSGYLTLNISSNNDKLRCIIRIQEISKEKLVKEWE
jgi:hypothetical protein